MIRKFGRLDAPRDAVARLFGDVEAWPQWMPGVKRLAVLARDERGLRIGVSQSFLGREFRQELEVRTSAASVALRQTAGAFRRWESTWRFSPPPDGSGTTVSLELDFDLGLLEWLSPRALVQGALDRLFAEGLQRAGQRLRSPAAPAAAEPAAAAEGDVLLQVFQTEGGLEIVVAGRRIALPLRV